MSPLATLKKTITILDSLPCDYCLVGGHAASLYRTQARLTQDVDFAIVGEPVEASTHLAQTCITRLGLEPMTGFIDDVNSGKPIQCLITAQPESTQLKGEIDILLPRLPWVVPAVQRAQRNQISFGSLRIPVITPEDMIISKLYALKNAPTRFQDLDDLKEIFLATQDLDIELIRSSMETFVLSIPDVVKQFADPSLR